MHSQFLPKLTTLAMSSNGSSFLLNTENYDPLFKIVRQITLKIRENEKILGRIANVVDERIRYPEFPYTDEIPLINDDEIRADVEYQISEEGDCLRNILDQKFAANKATDVHQFDDVENPILRQLLCDNFRLLQMKNAKIEKNRKLLEMNREYEQLLAGVIIPTLAQDVSKRNIENINTIQGDEVGRKLQSQQNIWNEYVNYVASIEKSVRLADKLTSVLEDTLDAGEMGKLSLQMLILESLKSQIVAEKKLRKVR